MSQKQIIFVGLICLALGACAPMKVNLAEQTEKTKQDLGLKNAYNERRCSFVAAPYGGRGYYKVGGICVMANKTIYVRINEQKEPFNSYYEKIPLSDMRSYSIHKGMLGREQLQIRGKKYLYGLTMRPEGIGYDNESTRLYGAEIATWGVPQTSSDAEVPTAVDVVEPSVYFIPVFTK